MSKMYAKFSNYRNRHSPLNGSITFDCSIHDLVFANARVGFSSLFRSILKEPYSRIAEFISRITLGYAYLAVRNGNLVLRDSFDNLDQSDKSYVSYRFGMAAAKLLSEWTLKIPHLMHFDAFAATGNLVEKGNTRKRPDLVGCDNLGNWHVIEAKGRTDSISNEDRDEAKIQAESVRKINGAVPETKTASLGLFRKDRIFIEMNDPDEVGEIEYEFGPNNYLREYYSFFRFLARDRNAFLLNRYDSFDGLEYSVPGLDILITDFISEIFPVKFKNLKFGIDLKIGESLFATNIGGVFDQVASFGDRINDIKQSFKSSQFEGIFAISPDGLYLKSDTYYEINS